MPRYSGDFALVCEGVTDYAVLKNILIGFFKGQRREPTIQQRQPDSDATGAEEWQRFGNWENVLRHLREGKHRQALQFNQYVVIQVDTDNSEHPNFAVPQQENGEDLEPGAMVQRVAEKLREIIGAEDCAAYGDRLIFAICVREIECWLLPLWEDGYEAVKTVGCIGALNSALARRNEPSINLAAKKVPPYENASKGYRKRAVLMNDGPRNPSLAVFLNELTLRQIGLPENE